MQYQLSSTSESRVHSNWEQVGLERFENYSEQRFSNDVDYSSYYGLYPEIRIEKSYHQLQNLELEAKFGDRGVKVPNWYHQRILWHMKVVTVQEARLQLLCDPCWRDIDKLGMTRNMWFGGSDVDEKFELERGLGKEACHEI